MNPKTWTNDNRSLVWTVSLNNNSLYCIYINSKLVYEDITFDVFYPLYTSIVNKTHPQEGCLS